MVQICNNNVIAIISVIGHQNRREMLTDLDYVRRCNNKLTITNDTVIIISVTL